MRAKPTPDPEHPPDRSTDPLQARKKAMDYLARREHGGEELRRKLIAAGFAADTADEAVARLTGEGLQSDRRFTESFIQSRIGQGKGPVRVRLELEQHGIDAAMTEECLAAEGEDWGELAGRVRERKFGPAVPADFRDKARQMRFLQYRGFETAHIQRALRGADED